MRYPMFLVFVLVLGLAACGGAPKPREEKTPFVYRHTRATIWEQVRNELRESWAIAEEDSATLTLKTDWDTRLAALNTFGRRYRLEVVVSGSDEDGYTVAAIQETEINTNQDHPLSAAEADWEPSDSDGSLAQGFLFNLHRRMNPGTPWKRDADR